MTGFVFATHKRARTFRRDQDDVPLLAGVDLLEVDVEAVCEQQRAAGLEIRCDRFLEHLGLLHVRCQQRDQVGLGGGLTRFEDGQAIGLRLVPARAVLACADDDLEAGVAQVQRMRAALAAVTDDGDGLFFQRGSDRAHLAFLLGRVEVVFSSPWLSQGEVGRGWI